MSNVRGKSFTAPRCRILVDGTIVGWATNVSVNVDVEYTDIQAIDSLEDIEHAPVSYKVSGSVGNVWISGETYKSKGFIPRSGKSSDEHLLNILQRPLHTIVFVDKVEGVNVTTVTGVTFSSHNMQVGAGAVGGRNINWKGIRETDESEA